MLCLKWRGAPSVGERVYRGAKSVGVKTVGNEVKSRNEFRSPQQFKQE